MKDLYNYSIKNGVKLRNRLVLAPMTTYSGNDDLTLSEEERLYYEARGKHFGMVITAATAISKHAQAFENQISIMSEKYLESMTKLAQAIKSGGAKAILQLHHGGRMNMPGLFEGQDIVSASAVKANRKYTVEPRALTTEEVYSVIEDFKKATILAIKAGFDGVELHGANTYLIQQFFSPNSNLRTDEFGGSLSKRLTFPLKLVEAAINARNEFSKPNFIIGYRLSPEELENPGITIEDTKVLVRELSKTEIDYIHFSLGSYKQSSIRDKDDKKMIINILKQENIGDKTLIGVGGIETLAQVNEALDLGYNLIAIGMASLADPQIAKHILANEAGKKVFDKNSLVPRKMMDRVKTWSSVFDRGYKVSEEL